MPIKFTDPFLKSRKSTGKELNYTDDSTPGLMFRVTTEQRKIFRFKYVSPRTKKPSVWKIGEYPATTLDEAREAARQARKKVLAGEDPQDEAPAEPHRTIEQLVEEYLSLVVRGKLDSAKEIERKLKKNVVPVVGAMLAKDFRVMHMDKCLKAMNDRDAPVEANRVFTSTKTMFAWAVKKEILDRNPLVAQEKPNPEKSKDRVLNRGEIATLWNDLPGAIKLRKKTLAPEVLKLCLITGQRISEVAGMHRSELDLEKRLWTIPKERVKRDRNQLVPLSPLALSVISERLEKTETFLFPNKRGDEPLPQGTINHTLDRALEPREGLPLGKLGIAKFTPHDLRRTCATYMQELGVRLEVTEAILNHVSGTKAGVVGIYQRYDWFKEKAEALNAWGQLLTVILAGDKVVQLPVKAA